MEVSHSEILLPCLSVSKTQNRKEVGESKELSEAQRDDVERILKKFIKTFLATFLER